jgi:hypothetical protein
LTAASTFSSQIPSSIARIIAIAVVRLFNLLLPPQPPKFNFGCVLSDDSIGAGLISFVIGTAFACLWLDII